MWHCSFAEAKHVYFSSRYPAPLDTWLAQRARSNALQNLSHVLVASRISEDDLPPEVKQRRHVVLCVTCLAAGTAHGTIPPLTRLPTCASYGHISRVSHSTVPNLFMCSNHMVEHVFWTLWQLLL